MYENVLIKPGIEHSGCAHQLNTLSKDNEVFGEVVTSSLLKVRNTTRHIVRILYGELAGNILKNNSTLSFYLTLLDNPVSFSILYKQSSELER